MGYLPPPQDSLTVVDSYLLPRQPFEPSYEYQEVVSTPNTPLPTTAFPREQGPWDLDWKSDFDLPSRNRAPWTEGGSGQMRLQNVHKNVGLGLEALIRSSL
jgi:hypothetical protein